MAVKLLQPVRHLSALQPPLRMFPESEGDWHRLQRAHGSSAGKTVRNPGGRSTSPKTDQQRQPEGGSQPTNILAELPRSLKMKMGIAVLCLCLLSAALWLGLTMTMSSEGGGPGGGSGGGGGGGGPGKPGGGGSGSSGCVPQSIPSEDIDICKALDVLYTELGIVSCKIIPQCNQYRAKISLWPQPTVKFPGALDGATYLLVMVDPDAPSRQDPRAKYWRHWLVSNIPGTSMKSGTIQGQVITEYQPPTPPPTTGLHRYQFFIYLQGTRNISISARENKNRGSWRLETFLQQHRLDDAVTSTQFMTEFEGELPPGFDRSGRKAKD